MRKRRGKAKVILAKNVFYSKNQRRNRFDQNKYNNNNNSNSNNINNTINNKKTYSHSYCVLAKSHLNDKVTLLKPIPCCHHGVVVVLPYFKYRPQYCQTHYSTTITTPTSDSHTSYTHQHTATTTSVIRDRYNTCKEHFTYFTNGTHGTYHQLRGANNPHPVQLLYYYETCNLTKHLHSEGSCALLH